MCNKAIIPPPPPNKQTKQNNNNKESIRKYFEHVSDLSTRCVALHVLPCGIRCADLSAVLCTSSQVIRVLQLVLLSVVVILLNSDRFFCVLRYVDLLSCGDSGQPQSVQILSYVVWACCLVVIPDNRRQFRFCPTLCGPVVLW